MRKCTLMVVALVLLAMPARADLPQFLGPNNTGEAPGVKLARSWPKDGPKVLWTLRTGPGFGGPAIHQGKVYLLDRDGRSGDVLLCIDLKTGKESWRFAYRAPGRLSYDGSRSTPAVDNKYVFTIGPFGHVYCVDKASHKAVWKKELATDFGSKRPNWGFSQSVLLYKEHAIIAPLSGRVGVAALEKATGKVVWTSKPVGPMRYMSPLLTTLAGVEQVIVASHRQTAGVDPATGKVLWTYGGFRCNIPVPSPVHVGGGRVFITGGYGAGSVMIQVTKVGGRFAVKELFRLKRLGCHIHPPLVYKDHLYAQFNTKRTKDGLACVDLEGNVKWKTGRSPNFDWGGLVLADGLILAMDGSSGVLRLIEPGPAGYKELASARLLSRPRIWGPMALTDGKLVCRDQREMKCVEVGAKP